MSAIHQINHNTRHLVTVNIFLQFAKHTSLLILRKFLPHHTQTHSWMQAICRQCYLQVPPFLWVPVPIITHIPCVPTLLLTINFLVRNQPQSPFCCTSTAKPSRWRQVMDGNCQADVAVLAEQLLGISDPVWQLLIPRSTPSQKFSCFFFILPSKIIPLFSLLVSLGYCLIQLVVTLSKMSVLISF